MIGRVLSPDHLIGSGVAEILIAVPTGNHEHFGREVRLSCKEKKTAHILFERYLKARLNIPAAAFPEVDEVSLTLFPDRLGNIPFLEKGFRPPISGVISTQVKKRT